MCVLLKIMEVSIPLLKFVFRSESIKLTLKINKPTKIKIG